MSPTHRVILLLSVAVLLREGSSSSPLDFLRDLKNRIFASENATESAENPSDQCSGMDQDNVCEIKKTTENRTQNENNTPNIESLDSELVNDTHGSNDKTFLTNQLEVNETVADDTYNANYTQYYDEQDWNNTATNNTEDGLNGTEFRTDALTSQGEETGNQTGNTRSKRQINKVEINITLKTPGVLKTKPLTTNAALSYGKTINSIGNFSTNQSSNLMESEQVNSKGSENSKRNIIEESNSEDLTKPIDLNKTVFETEIAGNETKDKLTNGNQKINESTSTSLENSEDQSISSNDTMIEFSESQNTTEEMNKRQSISINCTDCDFVDESNIDLQNITLGMDGELNKTGSIEYVQQQGDENSTHVNWDSGTNQTKITKLQDILDNSTLIIQKFVQNVAPMIINDVTNWDETNDTIFENLQNMNIKKDPHNILEILETKDHDKSKGKSQNFTSLANNTNGENVNRTIGASKEIFNISNNYSTIPEYLVQDLHESTEFESNSTTDNMSIDASKKVIDPIENSTHVKRSKRSINFTIVTEDDWEELDSSFFPDVTSSSPATEASLSNDTQTIEIAGPICTKQYEQCINSTDCCGDYECIVGDENNSTSYCDLRPVNLTLATSLPITTNSTD